jgi:hypothetical protein
VRREAEGEGFCHFLGVRKAGSLVIGTGEYKRNKGRVREEDDDDAGRKGIKYACFAFPDREWRPRVAPLTHYCRVFPTLSRFAMERASLGQTGASKSNACAARKGGRLAILDPQWNLLDVPLSGDPVEWLAVFWQCEVAALVGVTARPVRP